MPFYPPQLNSTLDLYNMNNYLRIAASQFPVSHDMAKNFEYINKLIEEASEHAVEVIHFPETALPGYLWLWQYKIDPPGVETATEN